MNLCHVCGKAFSCKGNMTRHLTETHGAPAHTCTDCGLAFRRKDYLKNHVVTGACGPNTLANECNIAEDSLGVHPSRQQGEGNGFGGSPSESVDRDSSAGGETSEEESARDVMDTDTTDGINTENSSYDSDECDSNSDGKDESSSADDCSCGDLGPGEEADSVLDEDEDEALREEKDAAHNEGEDTTRSERDLDGESAEQSRSESSHSNFARWRNEDNGVYVAWNSRSRMPFLIQNRVWLENLRHPPFHLQKQLITEATNSQLDTFREMALNVLTGQVAMPAQSYRNF